MRRGLLGALCVALLACSGIGESILEQATGGDVELMEGGMDLTLPDGGTIQLRWEDKATHAPEIPFTPPAGGVIGVSGVATVPSMPTSYFVVYSSTDNAEALVAQYTQEMVDMGLTPTPTTADDGTIQLQATRDDLTYFVAVPADNDEGNGVTLGVGSVEAIEQSLQQYAN